MRPVQIPCRFFRQVIDSAYLCRTRIDDIKILCCLFIYIYDIVVILSEAYFSGVEGTPVDFLLDRFSFGHWTNGALTAN
jgi:hypothetical protein